MLMDAKAIIRRMDDELKNDFQIEAHEASPMQLHRALSNAVMFAMADDWRRSRREHERMRRAYYFSAEYLMGRMIYNNLFNLGLLEELKHLLLMRGADLAALEDVEDAALGNGGLGRLAACFLDSAATHSIPLDGYGLRYKFGLFKQSFKGGFQCEKADDWQRCGDPWSKRRDDKTVTVEFKDQSVLAVPYDMPIVGYKTNNIGTLRLWQSEPLEEFDFGLFNDQNYDAAVKEKNKVEDITRVLYPNDSTYAGKQLRLKQQYFLSSASLQDIVRRYKRIKGNDLSGFAAHCAIQLNDTHPTVSVPELIRLLMLEGMEFHAALEVAKKTFSYTNHTIMSEALEKWDVELINSVIPEIMLIIYRIDAELRNELSTRGMSHKLHAMQIVDGNTVHMARLASYVSSAINGVARIHTEILKDTVLREWNELYPERFYNKTNGITQRRWLGLCNPELAAMFSRRIGDGFMTKLDELEKLKQHIDADMLREFNEIKHRKKQQLCRVIADKEGVILNPAFMFDVQVKRMHEYKRQLMNALSLIYIYKKLKAGELGDFTPTAYIFGAKAAPGYYRAKGVIKLINEIAGKINNDADVRNRMQVVFVQNYNCSYAEHIIPAADVSEQISPAGTEASGTGNMKLMLNGAVTLGTYDGANIEIAEAAGIENNYIFGAVIDEIRTIEASYDPRRIYEQHPDIRSTLDTLIDGTFSDNGTGVFRELYDAILNGASWHKADHYYILLDFLPYVNAKLAVNRDYKDKNTFARKCLMNAASAGRFSSDRTVREYADEIWHIFSGD